MIDERKRVGGHVDTEAVERLIGTVPRVGDVFEAEGLGLRVVSRTVGITALDVEDAAASAYDWLYVCTAEPVLDVQAAIDHIRDCLGLVDEAAEEPPALEVDVLREIEDILRAA